MEMLVEAFTHGQCVTAMQLLKLRDWERLLILRSPKKDSGTTQVSSGEQYFIVDVHINRTNHKHVVADAKVKYARA